MVDDMHGCTQAKCKLGTVLECNGFWIFIWTATQAASRTTASTGSQRLGMVPKRHWPPPTKQSLIPGHVAKAGTQAQQCWVTQWIPHQDIYIQRKPTKQTQFLTHTSGNTSPAAPPAEGTCLLLAAGSCLPAKRAMLTHPAGWPQRRLRRTHFPSSITVS